MSVKKNNRHQAMSAPLGKARELVNQILILTRPRIINEDGSQTKPGLLGEGQPLYAFGNDLIACGKRVHAYCYEAAHHNLRNYESWQQRATYLHKARDNCDSILRQLDLCIYQYARSSQRKLRSFECCARLTHATKQLINDRLNRDKLIYEQHYKDK